MFNKKLKNKMKLNTLIREHNNIFILNKDDLKEYIYDLMEDGENIKAIKSILNDFKLISQNSTKILQNIKNYLKENKSKLQNEFPSIYNFKLRNKNSIYIELLNNKQIRISNHPELTQNIFINIPTYNIIILPEFDDKNVINTLKEYYKKRWLDSISLKEEHESDDYFLYIAKNSQECINYIIKILQKETYME